LIALTQKDIVVALAQLKEVLHHAEYGGDASRRDFEVGFDVRRCSPSANGLF
jgi:hypothetical protein